MRVQLIGLDLFRRGAAISRNGENATILLRRHSKVVVAATGADRG
jgi:hypothetical protein